MGGKDIGAAELREKLTSDLLLIFLVLGLPIGMASSSRTFVDGDTSWHIAVGRWITEHGRVPGTDVFSYTAFGRPWVAMEWPADLIFAGAYRLAGYAGLATVVAAAVMGLHWVLYLYLRRRLSAVGLALTFITMDLVVLDFMLARPHVLVWPVLAAWTVLLAKSTETGRPPPLGSALLLTLWANLHGSFPMAAVIGGFLALDALIAAQWKTLRQWLIFAGACLVAVCLQVNGLAGILQPFRVANLKTLHLINEWLPTTTGNSPIFYAALLLTLGMLLWRGVRVPIGRLLLLLVMVGLAFTQMRHQSWLGIVAAVLVPPLVATREAPEGSKLWPFAIAAVPLLIARALWPLTPPDTVSNPRNLIAHIPAELKSQPVFNGYSFGGPLILAGIKPYIDGRSELYGDDFMTDYDRIARGDWPSFDRAVKHYNIRWAVLPTDGMPLRDEVARSREWHRVYTDKVGEIYVRND